jgi:hypothetical protein
MRVTSLHGSGSAACQIPEKSGLPSAVLEAGAAGLALPSAVRGTPAVGYFSHCAVRQDAGSRQTAISLSRTRRLYQEEKFSRLNRGRPSRSVRGALGLTKKLQQNAIDLLRVRPVQPMRPSLHHLQAAARHQFRRALARYRHRQDLVGVAMYD